MSDILNIPSPLQNVNWALAESHGVDVYMKREDLIHSTLSGNKWRKLVYNVLEIKQRKLSGLVTFGGAFSNHIAATAYAGKINNIQTIGIIRGEEADFENPTLKLAQENGMQLLPVSREEYRLKTDVEYLKSLQEKFPDFLIVPEGGANLNGVKGCMEILQEVEIDFDVVACPVGTSTTFSGLVASAGAQRKAIGFTAVKGGDYLRADVNNFLHRLKAEVSLNSNLVPTSNWQLQTEYHFGGFAKMKEPLVRFMNAFYAETNIPLDPVYTAKMMYGLQEMILKNEIEKGSRVLVIHTGGLQGIAGVNKRLLNKNYSIEYEHKI